MEKMATATDMLVNELSHGREQAKRLKAQLNKDSNVCLIEEVIACIEKAMARANSAPSATDSPRSFTGSPQMEDLEQPFKDQCKAMTPKKRKTQTKRTNHVKLGSGPEAQGPLDDGYSWRKYGQKEILGAKNPRGYFRCTHRNSQNCLAIKQVQKSDENPLIYEVTYRGNHSCDRKPLPLLLPPTPSTTISFPSFDHTQDGNQRLLSFQTNLKVETENLDSKFQGPPSPPFSFPSTPIENCFKRSFTDAFVSPTTTMDSNYFSTSPCIAQPSECDFGEIISKISPNFDDDFMCEWDADFQFGPTSFIL